MKDNGERANRILEAAERLVMQYGFDKTTVDDVAREAGVSKGAIYLHWPSKDDLFEALIWRETWAYIDDMMNGINADPQGGTLIGMYKHALLPLHKRPLMRALYNRDLRILGDFMKRRDPSLFQRRYLINKEFIQAMQSLGLVRKDIDSEAVGHLFSAFGQGILSMNAIVPDAEAPSFERVMGTLTDTFGRALTPEGGVSEDQINAGKKLLNDIMAAYKAANPNTLSTR